MTDLVGETGPAEYLCNGEEEGIVAVGLVLVWRGTVLCVQPVSSLLSHWTGCHFAGPPWLPEPLEHIRDSWDMSEHAPTSEVLCPQPNPPSALLQRCEEVEVMKGQVCQEQKLRAVAESCLMERDEAWSAIQCQLREAQAITKDAGVLLEQIK